MPSMLPMMRPTLGFEAGVCDQADETPRRLKRKAATSRRFLFIVILAIGRTSTSGTIVIRGHDEMKKVTIRAFVASRGAAPTEARRRVGRQSYMPGITFPASKFIWPQGTGTSGYVQML